MRKLLFALIIVLAALAPLAANTLVGFGFTFSGDIVSTHTSVPLLSVDWVGSYTGIGFNADVYVGQKLGFFAGGAFGLLTGIDSDTTMGTLEIKGKVDMDNVSTKLFGNALLGLGAFLPMGSFDLSGAVGFGFDFLSTRYTGSDTTNTMASLGPGLSMSLGIPVSTNVEAYASCRLIYGLIRMGDYPQGYKGDFSFTPALGVRIKV
jgi:hypothetical protein